MKKIVICIYLIATYVSGQTFSEDVKKFISVDTNIVAITKVGIIDGTGSPIKPDQTIVFSNGKITQLGSSNDIKIPKGSLVIDGSNKTIIPGLVMLHEHMYISAHSTSPFYLNSRQLPVSFPRLYLAAGATNIRTCGSVDPFSDLRIKKDIDNGNYPGPHIDLTAPYLEGKEARFPQMNELQSPEDAVKFVNFWADLGFTSFKAYTGIDKPTLKAAIDAAHQRNLKVTGHLCSVTYREAAELGINNLEHGFLASTDFAPNKLENECISNPLLSLAEINIHSDYVKALMSFLIEKNVGITSTLAVLEGFTSDQPAPSNTVLNMFAPDNRDAYLKALSKILSRKSPTDFDKAYQNAAKMEKLFYDMGGLVTTGTDPTGNGGTIAGYGTWRTIELLVEASGFTTLEAIKIATLNGAI